MTWEEKFDACAALTGNMDISLHMRKPGDWYVEQVGVEVKNDGVLEGRYGNGRTPKEAVEHHWLRLTTLAPDEYLVIHAMRPTRRAVRWNGYMWAAVTE